MGLTHTQKKIPHIQDKGEATTKQQEGHNYDKIKSFTGQVGDSQTGEQLYQRISCTVTKVLGPTSDFPTWEFSKGTENAQGI